MRFAYYLLLAACIQSTPTNVTEVPRAFLESPVVLFSSALRQGPGIEAIVLPHQPATIVMDGDRVRVMSADGTTIFYQANIVSEDPLRGMITIQQDAPGIGSSLLGGIAEGGRAAQMRSLRFNEGALVAEVSLFDPQAGRWDFVESILPTVKDSPEPVTVDRTRFNALTTGAYVTRPDTRKKTMDWYASPESPENTFVDLRLGVEAWNRYFATFTDFRLVFKGYLPDGVVVGDPHYNVIVVSNNDPGAAYESQGYNPYTGLQTHSLVFVPLGWYYRDVSSTEAGALPKLPSLLSLNRAQLKTWLREGKGFPRPSRTVPSLPGAIDVSNLKCAFVPRVYAQDDQHGAMLVRAVVMHEVGHALGLGHNFRGSEGANFSAIGTPDFRFTNSIMDYNIYPFEERYLFDGPDTSDGPQLAYDAQIIDAIYNGGGGLTDAPVLPMCTDLQVNAQSASTVDPTCWPYDFGPDPSVALRVARARLVSPSARTPEAQLLTVAGAADAALTAANTNLTPVDQMANELAVVLRNVAVDEAISLSGAMSASIRMLAEWDLPRNANPADTTTQALGLPGAAIKDGKIDPPSYVAYQRQVRAQLQSLADDAYAITRDDSGALARRYTDATDMTVKKTTDPVGSDLLTASAAIKQRLTARANAQRLLSPDGVDALLSAANKTIDDTVLAIAAQLAFEVYFGFPDIPGFAPLVLADTANHYFNVAQALASDPLADGGARVAALYNMGWIAQTRPYADGAAIRASRITAFGVIQTTVENELLALSNKRVSDGYLNEEDNDRFGWLNALAALADQLQDP